ncbi:MAG TPA: SMC family ATPase [Thermoplasmata archaeon]|nr:SMC family ATPase [Thermoplasmata archaeon]
MPRGDGSVQLRRLHLRNIRSYESADVEFGGGTTLVAGDVGSGKTSLLYAIEMALFGVAEVNAAYLVRHGASHAEVSVEFEGPEHRYDISRRFRRLRRKGQETFEAERIRFTVDGAETSYSATELRQRVIDLLGFPDNPSPQAHSDLWRWAVYVPQERMRDILGARPQDRLETVRKALGVERYRTAAENAEDLARDLRRSAAARRNEAERLRHFDEEFSEGTRLAERLRVDRVALDRALREHRTAVRTLETQRDEVEAKARRAVADDRELAALEREVAVDQKALEGQLAARADREREAARRREEANGARAEAEHLPSRSADLADADTTLGRLHEEAEKDSERLRRLAEARASLTSAERHQTDLRLTFDRARTEEGDSRRAHEGAIGEGPAKEPPAPTAESLAALDERIERLRGEEATDLGVVAQAETAEGELEKLLRGGVCPRCHQAVRAADFESHRTEASQAVKAARKKLESARSELAHVVEARRSRERYERAFDRWKESEKLRASTRAVLDRATRAVGTARSALETASASLETARQNVSELESAEASSRALREEIARAERVRAERAEAVERARLAVARSDGIENALTTLTAEIARIDREVARSNERITERAKRAGQLRTSHGESEALGDAAAEANRRLAQANDELAQHQSMLASLDAQVDEADRRVRAAENGRRERAELVAEAKEVEEKAGWVGTAFRATVLEMEQKLLTHAQALFEREFARYFASLVDDPGLIARTDPAFTPLVMIEGEWTPAEALSGGERTSLALAFRLALARVVRSMGSLHLDTILLDEPTDGFSPEQVVRMGELLEELALPQVILVSHESELAAVADRVVRVEKVDGRSLVTSAAALDGPGATARRSAN